MIFSARWVQSVLMALSFVAAVGCGKEDDPGPCDAYAFGATIQTVAEWDDFVASGCLDVPGDVRVYAVDPLKPSPAVRVGGNLFLGALGGMESDPLPALTAVGRNVIVDPGVTTLRLPSLSSAGQIFAVASDLVTIDLPALTTVDHLTLFANDSLASVGLPVLLTVTGSPGISIQSNSSLATLSLPSLHTLSGTAGLSLSANAQLSTIDLPVLASVGGRLEVSEPKLSALSLPSLATVGGDLAIGFSGALADVGLPSLRTVGGYANLLDLPVLVAADLGSLASVANGFSTERTGLMVLSCPSLASVGKGPFAWGLVVKDNGVMTSFAFPALSSVGGELEVTGNASLPECLAVALRDQLTSLGGGATISGNDTAATCP